MHFPVYIDPSINPTSTTASNHYDEVYSNSSCADSPQYDTPQTAGEGAGYMQWGDGCGVGLERSLYALSLPTNIPTNAVVTKSQLTAPDTYAASWDCTHNQPVYLHTVGGGDHATIYSSTDWNNQPSSQDTTYTVPSTTVASGSNPSSSCSNKDAVFDTKTPIQKMINLGNTVWTVALRGDESQSSSNDNFLRFSTRISVTTTVDVPPNTPTNLHTAPQSINPTGPGCNNSGTGWIGASGAGGVTFSADLSTDMSGENLAAVFDVWDNTLDDGTGHSTTVNNKTVGWVASGGTETTSITPQDGHYYGWGADRGRQLVPAPDVAVADRVSLPLRRHPAGHPGGHHRRPVVPAGRRRDRQPGQVRRRQHCHQPPGQRRRPAARRHLHGRQLHGQRRRPLPVEARRTAHRRGQRRQRHGHRRRQRPVRRPHRLRHRLHPCPTGACTRSTSRPSTRPATSPRCRPATPSTSPGTRPPRCWPVT
ncbi:hypothetical protein ACFQZC_03270 [Streptacidiphilus monticola]